MNGTIPQTSAAAPSAAPAPAAPAPIAAPTPAAPSAPEMDPSNLAYYDRLASEALVKGSQASPAAAPAPGNGSPPAAPPAAPDSAAAPVAPAAVQTSEPPVAPATAAPATDDEPEPTPEEQATWTEGERRLHKALVKEREKNKDSRRQLSEFKEKLDKLTTPPAAPDANAPQAPARPAQPPRALEECHTPEAVEHLTVEAISMDSKMTRLQSALQRNNTAGVIQFLKAEGKQAIGATPIDEATPEQLSEYVTSVQEGARYIQAQAQPRMRYLSHQAAAWSKATEMIPELKANPNSDRAKSFVAIVQQNPWLRQQGPNWPIIAAKYLIGDERTNATPAVATAPVVTPQPAPPVATARPAPAPPRTAPVAPAQASEVDRLRAKMSDGSATEADIDRYAALSINAPAPAQA